MMSSDSVEHLSLVHNNPFIRQFGLPHHSTNRQDLPADNERSISSSTTNSERGEEDADQEYHVNSGFVNKLRSKFAQLENKGHKVTLSRKSASVENLLSLGSQSEGSYSRGPKLQKDDSSVSNHMKVDLRKPSGYRPQIRPRSHDLLETSSRSKPAVQQRKNIEVDFLKQKAIRSVKPPLPKKSSVDVSATLRSKQFYRKSSSDTIVPRQEHHDWKVAPDLEKIGRDNIVIIENEKVSEPVSKSKSEDTDDVDGNKQVKPVTDKHPVSDENELPKPNTVSQFRTLFEKPGQVPAPLTVWRQHSPTRKPGSGNNSPNVTSPRSPLTRMNSDNVFEEAVGVQYNRDKSISPRQSTNIDTNLSPRNSSSVWDTGKNVDTNSPVQKSFDVHPRKSSVDLDKSNDNIYQIDNRKSSEIETERALSPSVQRALSPVHPLSNIFDSKSVARDKHKRPKQHVVNKRQKHHIPKDTIELKHETERLISEQLNITKVVEIEDKPVDDNSKRISDEFSFDGVSNESAVKPSSKKSGKISPRKTKIFDSSNMKKKEKETPKSPVSLAGNAPNFTNYVPKQPEQIDKLIEKSKVSVDNEIKTEVSIEVVPTRNVQQSSTGMKELKPKIVTSERIEHKPKAFKVKEQNFVKPEVPAIKNDTERVKPVVNNDDDQVVSGMSSFLANRLKKTKPDLEHQSSASSNHLTNGSSPSSVPRKRQAPSVPNGSNKHVDMETDKETPPLPSTPQPDVVKPANTGVVISRKKKPQPATKMVFDSSKIATKRKEPPKRKPARKTLEQLNQNITFDNDVPAVPKLDLSSITDEKPTEYQEGYIPTVIKPCTVKFVGAEVKFAKSPYKKSVKVKKCKIMFDDHATTTFEYEGEESALENYLVDHPEERDEVLRLEDEFNGITSSTDSTAVDLLHDSPRAPPPSEPEVTIKSNTIIGSSTGGLTSYKSKIQTQEFQFGMTPDPEEQSLDDYFTQDIDNNEDDVSINLLPAEETENDTFSAEVDKADMLF